MLDPNNKIALQEQEMADIKLELNQCQQINASLELEVKQTEEVINKINTEAELKRILYEQELKQLREKLESDVKETDKSKKLKETMDKIKSEEEKAMDQLNKLRTIMVEYVKLINKQNSYLEKLKKEHDIANEHFQSLEVAFSDIHLKYEKSKTIIEGYKNNEKTLQHILSLANEMIEKNIEKCESFEVYAKDQTDKLNKELNVATEEYEMERDKQSAIIKRLQIKNSSLAKALEQKINECGEMAALCDEVTGNIK